MKTKFSRSLSLLTLVPLLFAMVGCAFYPMGLSKEQWEALTPAQQAEYQAQQTAIDARRNEREQIERARREEEARARQEAERERIAASYRHARYGDIVTVSVQDGMVAFDGKRFPFEPVAFNLVAGERKEVEFVRRGKSHSRTLIVVQLSEDGNTFIFDEPSRRRFVATSEGWEHGKEYHPPEIRGNDGHSEAIGVTIRIKYRDMPDGHNERRRH